MTSARPKEQRAAANSRYVGRRASTQLLAALADGDRRDRRFFQHAGARPVPRLPAFLTEACAARDYLAWFLARHVYGGVEADSVASLLKKKKSSSHPIDAILAAANDKATLNPGWCG